MPDKPTVIVWGPGHVGSAVLRAIRRRGDVELVGVKAFNPAKDGRDVGELIGIDPIGLAATTSREEILALDADCVIVTPATTAMMRGLDEDVLALLRSGKNVVCTGAYHNVAMPNWLTRARDAGALGDRLPRRATPAEIAAACAEGGVSLYGGGVHPTLMVEQFVTRLMASLDVRHLRFVESVDFGMSPDGMWGGLHSLGFGLPLEKIHDDFSLAMAGDFYYGDLTGNVGHLLLDAAPGDIDVRHQLRALPAVRDRQSGETHIAEGSAGVLHLTHTGRVGEHHYFTNEECWYVGEENAFHGDDPPFGNHGERGGWSFEIDADPVTISGQVGARGGDPDAITHLSVAAMLDAVSGVVAAPTGVVIDAAATRAGVGHDIAHAIAFLARTVEEVERIDIVETGDLLAPHVVAIADSLGLTREPVAHRSVQPDAAEGCFSRLDSPGMISVEVVGQPVSIDIQLAVTGDAERGTTGPIHAVPAFRPDERVGQG